MVAAVLTLLSPEVAGVTELTRMLAVRVLSSSKARIEDLPQGQLAGKIATVIDLMTRLPVQRQVS
jgi:hypothetical protein